MKQLDFFDIPVYRLTREAYEATRDKHIEAILHPPNDAAASEMNREFHARNPDQELTMRDHLEKQYGGMWLYNEIIGYIRLHFLGDQIRGEYYKVDAKKIVKSRTKTLAYHAWKIVDEEEIPPGATNEAIFEAIMAYLSRAKKELKGRYVDTELFERIGPDVNWVGVLTRGRVGVSSVSRGGELGRVAEGS
jgi:hypothetical protein